MTLWIGLGIAAVLASLAAAGYFMLKGGADDNADQGRRRKHMARALAVRVVLSLVLFLGILLAHWMGWIEPSGFAANR